MPLGIPYLCMNLKMFHGDQYQQQFHRNKRGESS